MKKVRVLYVSQEITPFVDENEMSTVARKLPQGTQESGKEIRTFMPKFGCINERRNQLHEVIRLSGMNLIINDSDHPLIIKVASIPTARMQVYFIDNEEYFQRKALVTDAKGKYFKDNDDRTIFFCRGVLETVKKLGWNPDIVHCHGWMTSIIPTFIKTAYKEDPVFKNTKVVYSIYDNEFEGSWAPDFNKRLMMEGMTTADVKDLKDPNYVSLTNNAIKHSDAIIRGSQKFNPAIETYLKKSGKQILPFQETENVVTSYNDFYEEIMEAESELA